MDMRRLPAQARRMGWNPSRLLWVSSCAAAWPRVYVSVCTLAFGKLPTCQPFRIPTAAGSQPVSALFVLSRNPLCRSFSLSGSPTQLRTARREVEGRGERLSWLTGQKDERELGASAWCSLDEVQGFWPLSPFNARGKTNTGASHHQDLVAHRMNDRDVLRGGLASDPFPNNIHLRKPPKKLNFFQWSNHRTVAVCVAAVCLSSDIILPFLGCCVATSLSTL